jgi:hypothetical protein
MALPGALRQLVALAGASSASIGGAAAACTTTAPAAALVAGARRFAAPAAAFSRKDAVYNLANSSDPEAEASIRAFQREQFAAAAKGGAAGAGQPEVEYELASQIERKYAAAAVVESGIQVSEEQEEEEEEEWVGAGSGSVTLQGGGRGAPETHPPCIRLSAATQRLAGAATAPAQPSETQTLSPDHTTSHSHRLALATAEHRCAAQLAGRGRPCRAQALRRAAA